MATETDIAYIAGLIDGEGYIGIKRAKAYKSQGRKTPSYSARIQVRMVDEPAIAFMGDVLDGWYYQEKARSERGRPLYCFQLSHRKAEAALRRVLPYLKVKREVAETVLAFCALKATSTQHRTKITGYRDFPNSHGVVRRVANLALSDDYVSRCEAFWSRCRELNRVGI